MRFTGALFIALACSLSMLSSFTHASEQATLPEFDEKRKLRTGRGEGSSGSNGDICDQCPKEYCLASINLEGFNALPFTIIPAIDSEGFPQKVGSTATIFEQGVVGTAQYDDKGIDINATITGTCTILSTNTTDEEPFVIDRCLLHCTWCVTYSGYYCEESYNGYRRALWGNDTTYEEKCCDILGFATLTGDIVLDIQLDENSFNKFTDYYGQFAITGTAYDLTGAVNGGIGIIEYQNPESYKFDIKVPFSDECACNVSDSAFNYLYA